MKANAPGDIYLLPDERNSNGLSICWYEAPYRTGAIEYIRTDAFIEKAKKWFKHQPETYDANGVRVYWEEDFEDFRKYIEG